MTVSGHLGRNTGYKGIHYASLNYSMKLKFLNSGGEKYLTQVVC